MAKGWPFKDLTPNKSHYFRKKKNKNCGANYVRPNNKENKMSTTFVVVQLLSCVQVFVTPRAGAHQASPLPPPVCQRH